MRKCSAIKIIAEASGEKSLFPSKNKSLFQNYLTNEKELFPKQCCIEGGFHTKYFFAEISISLVIFFSRVEITYGNYQCLCVFKLWKYSGISPWRQHSIVTPLLCSQWQGDQRSHYLTRSQETSRSQLHHCLTWDAAFLFLSLHFLVYE